MTLYEIDEAIQKAFLEAVNPETGEIISEEAIANLDALEMERDEKIEKILLYYKDCLADAEKIKAEKIALGKRQAILENKAENLKNYAKMALAGEKFNRPRVSVSYRTTKSVNITDVWSIPAEYVTPVEPKADKKAIMAAMKGGQNIPGAEIVENTNITIR